MKTAEAIKNARKALRMSQSQLAAATGIPQSSISPIERGHRLPGDPHVPRLARALGLDIGEVFALVAEDKTAAALADLGDEIES